MRFASRALACLLTASAASAEITDPELTCSNYLKASAHKPKAHHAAAEGDVEARIKAFCAANPKMKAMDAEMTVTGD